MELSSLWGIDLGQECLSAVFLQRVSGRYEVAKFTRIDYELPLTGQYPPEKIEILEKAFRTFREREGVSTEQPVALAISGLEATSLPVRLPPISKRIEDLVDLEVSQNPPIQGKDFLYRFQMLPTDTLEERRIFLIAYPKVEVDAVVEAAARAKLRIQTLQSSPASLVNYLRFDLRNLDKTLLVHMRRDATDLVLGTEAGIWFRSIPEGANSLRLQLRKELGIPIGEAREILEDFLRGVPRTPYTIACDEFLDRVQAEVQKALDYQFLHFSFSQPEKVIVLGECARVPGTLTHFSEKFRCWIERVEKAQRVGVSEAVLATMPGKNLPTSGAAIGAALQGMGAIAGTPSFANGDARSIARGAPATLVAATTAASASSAPASPATPATAGARPFPKLSRVAAAAALLVCGVYAAMQWLRNESEQARLASDQARVVAAETQISLRRQLRDIKEEIDRTSVERDLLFALAKPDRGIAEACASLSRILPGNATLGNVRFEQSPGEKWRGEFVIHYPGSDASLTSLLRQEGIFGEFGMEDLGAGKFRVSFGASMQGALR